MQAPNHRMQVFGRLRSLPAIRIMPTIAWRTPLGT